jgi:hypothetical protein
MSFIAELFNSLLQLIFSRVRYQKSHHPSHIATAVRVMLSMSWYGKASTIGVTSAISATFLAVVTESKLALLNLRANHTCIQQR